MPEQVLFGLVGMLLVLGVYFWFVRKPNPTDQP